MGAVLHLMLTPASLNDGVSLATLIAIAIVWMPETRFRRRRHGVDNGHWPDSVAATSAWRSLDTASYSASCKVCRHEQLALPRKRDDFLNSNRRVLVWCLAWTLCLLEPDKQNIHWPWNISQSASEFERIWPRPAWCARQTHAPDWPWYAMNSFSFSLLFYKYSEWVRDYIQKRIPKPKTATGPSVNNNIVKTYES